MAKSVDVSDLSKELVPQPSVFRATCVFLWSLMVAGQGSGAAAGAQAACANPTASVPWKGLIPAKPSLEPPQWHPAADIN